MLYNLEAVKANVRNRDGKRVFFLGKGDQLTTEARDHLNRERIEIRPGEQARITRYRLLGGRYFDGKAGGYDPFIWGCVGLQDPSTNWVSRGYG